MLTARTLSSSYPSPLLASLKTFMTLRSFMPPFKKIKNSQLIEINNSSLASTLPITGKKYKFSINSIITGYYINRKEHQSCIK